MNVADEIDARQALDLALDLFRRGDPAAAAAICRRLLVRRPDHWQAWHLLGVIALKRGRPDIARPILALAARCHAAPMLASLATAHRALDEIEPALAALRRAVALCPDVAEYHFNLGNVLQRHHDFTAAVAAYRAALAVAPDMVAAHWNRALALLRLGRFAEAWPDYEWRWRRPGTPQHYLRQRPGWDGTAFAGRTLLLYAEQGFGDALQFIRYLPRVLARGGKVVVEVPAPLVRLIAASFPGVAVLAKGTPVPPFDLQAALPSLPAIFATTLDDLPATVPYLVAPADGPRLTPPEAWPKAWPEAWPETGSGGAGSGRAGRRRTVGLVWASSPTDPSRSLPAAALAPLLADRRFAFFSLQLGPARQELARLGPAVTDLAPLIGDFADTAALLAQLDLVISVDTAAAHLAGALARPTLLLLPHLADWRWLTNRRDSPWYPSLTLFRQTSRGCWEAPLTALAAHLALAAGGEPVP